MDPRLNPYTPNAGARPPVLVGRGSELEAFDIVLHRLLRGRTEQSLLVTGLRGVGKTVLLSAFEEIAVLAGWVTVETEITKGLGFGPRMAQLVHQALLQLAPGGRWRDKVRRAASVLTSFALTVSTDGSVTGSLNIDPAEGAADSGDLGGDLTDLLVALGGAAEEQEAGVAFLFDEVQFLSKPEFEALIAALHKVVQRSLPVTFVGAGLPQLPRLAAEAKSYAERLFRVHRLEPLSPDGAAEALTAPAAALDVSFEPKAVATVVEYTQGYPYFIQEYGKVLWNQATASPITAIAAVEAQALVEAKLDESFFRTRVERVSETELVYLRAMAELGSGPNPASAVAALLGKSLESIATTRARLIDKGLVFAPSRGLGAFTVPQFDRFLRRAYPQSTRSLG
jgi:hypothetical protein